MYFPGRARAENEHERAPERFAAAIAQLEQCFNGDRRTLELPLELRGSAFQRGVWRALQQITYATTTTYGALAHQLTIQRGGCPIEPQAVAAAVARIPVPIIIPCHRVTAADGSLRRYLGGVHRKRALLDFEASAGDPNTLNAAWHQRQLALL